MKFRIVKSDNRNESGPAGIEVGPILRSNSVCSCLGPFFLNNELQTVNSE